MAYSFKPQGICAGQINFDVKDGKVTGVKFLGIENLVEGMDIDEVIKRLRGLRCGMRESSCPDQLAVALEKYKEKMANK